MERIILHVDVNNAYLSWTAIWLLKNGHKTDIRERYAVIGGDESQRRGIVLAKSNPCKKKGVVTAETIGSARRKCPYLEVYAPNFRVYKFILRFFFWIICYKTNSLMTIIIRVFIIITVYICYLQILNFFLICRIFRISISIF